MFRIIVCLDVCMYVYLWTDLKNYNQNRTYYFRKKRKNYLQYRKIPNISPGLMEVCKHFLGGLYSRGLIFGGHFVLVPEYQDLLLYIAITGKKGVSLGQNHLYFALNPI